MKPTAMIERHWHWQFTVFDDMTEDGRGILWPVSVEVVGYESESDASVMARQIVPRQQCKLARVWECASCAFQSRQVAALTELSGKL